MRACAACVRAHSPVCPVVAPHTANVRTSRLSPRSRARVQAWRSDRRGHHTGGQAVPLRDVPQGDGDQGRGGRQAGRDALGGLQGPGQGGVQDQGGRAGGVWGAAARAGGRGGRGVWGARARGAALLLLACHTAPVPPARSLQLADGRENVQLVCMPCQDRRATTADEVRCAALLVCVGKGPRQPCQLGHWCPCLPSL